MIPGEPPDKVLLIGWDAAEWSVIRPLVNQGKMPNLTRLIEGGISGNLRSIYPQHSPMVWTSIATGKRPHKHGVCGHFEVRSDGRDVRPVSRYTRQVKAIWNILSENSKRTHCINWSATSPAEPVNGVLVPDQFFAAPPNLDSVYPPSLTGELKELRAGPGDLDPAMVLEMLPRGISIDPRSDRRLIECANILAESASVQAVTCRLMEHHPWDFTCVLCTGLERFSAAFMRYQPPRQAHICDRDFLLFSSVLTVAYELHDMMLGRLVELAGDKTTILLVSDHGYRTGSRRRDRDAVRSNDDAAASHTSQGILVMRGPGVLVDETIEGASVLDITPTILNLMGIRTGADMDGRPLQAAFVQEMEPAFIPSWETIKSPEWSPPAEPVPEIEPELRYLAELGYTEPPGAEARFRIRSVWQENTYNLARSLIDARQTEPAIPLLESLVRLRPDWADLNKTLFQAYLSVGRLRDARGIVQRSWEMGERGPILHLGFATVDLAERKPVAALDHLNLALDAGLLIPDLHLLIGQVYLRLRQWELAEHAFCKELATNSHCELAWAGRAVVALARAAWQDAAEHALQAVGLRPDYAQAHYHLGIALIHMQRLDRATVALRRCLQIDPDFIAAGRSLITLYEGPLSNFRLAGEIRQEMADCLLRRHRYRQPGANQPAGFAAASRALSV